MQDNSQNTFTGGLDRDSDYRVIKNDRYVDATDVDTYSNDRNSTYSVSPLHSSTSAFTIPSIASQAQITKLYYEAGVDIFFSFYDAETNILIGNGVVGTGDNSSFNTFRPFFTNILNSYGYLASDFVRVGEYFKFTITPNNTNGKNRIYFEWYKAGEFPSYKDEVILQEYYPSNTLQPIGAVSLQDNLFTVSTTLDNDAIEIGVGKETNGSWTYTRLFRTWRWNYPTNEAIDIRIEEISSENYALYVVQKGIKPKVYYISKTLTQDVLLKYDNTNWLTPSTYGYLIYNVADEQTNLQIINNTSFVKFESQQQNGGALLSGGYRYSIRCGVNGTLNTTEWSVLNANVIPVFKTNVDAPSGYIKIQGDKSGELTGKSNVLKLENLKPNIFNYVELACAYNANGATSATIVGKYPITSNIMYITHSGLEQNTQQYDATLLPQTEPLVKSAKTLEIKKNRLNLANVDIAADENIADSIKALFDNSSFQTFPFQTEGVGTLVRNNNVTFSAAITNSSGIPWPWNIVTPGYQTGSGYLKFQNSTQPQYNSSTGIWTVAVSGKYRINTYFWFTAIDKSTFGGGLNFLLQQKRGATINTIGYFRFDANNQSQGIDVTVDLAAGDEVYFECNYQFKKGDGGSFYINSALFAPSPITTDTTQDFSNSKVGEYQLPENCANRVGYTLRESYPFFAKLHYKNGYVSSPYYIGTKTFQPHGNQTDAFTNITANPKDHSIYIYGLALNNLDVSTLKDEIDGISIWRGVCNPTILGTGIVMAADNFDAQSYTVGYYPSIPVYNGHYGVAIPTNNDARKFGMFISPDTQYNKVEPNAGDKLIFMSTAAVMNNVGNSTGGTPYRNPVVQGSGSFAEYYGARGNGTLANNEVTVTDGQYITFDAAISDPNSQLPPITSGNLSYRINTNIKANGRGSMEGMALGLASRLFPSNSTSDNGVYMAQYKRTLSTPQYDLTSVDIVPTGTFIPVTPQSSIIEGVYIFGGDTYTQKNILKVMYWGSDGTNVFSSFITYYAQSKINTQLFYCDDNEAVSQTKNLQGWKNIVSYLFPFEDINTVAQEQFNYDKAYSAQYPFTEKPYDPNVPQQSKFGSRIYYSEQKPLNSVQDFYRKILALDYRDLDSKNGDIAAIRDVNNYMIAIQPRAVSVLPYQSDVAITSQDGNPILVGNGGVYNQRENIVSTYGTNLQSCVLVGNNNNGNSQLYWYSPQFKKFCRYGADGIRIISDEQMMRSYFLNEVNQINSEYNMVMAYNVEYASVIITMFGTTNNTLMFNEKSNNFSTFASFKPIRYFFFKNKTIAPQNSASGYNQLYDLFGDKNNYLYFLGNTQGQFSITLSSNKGGTNDKRFLSCGVMVGAGYNFTNPSINLSTDSPVAFPYSSSLGQKRYDNYVSAFNNDNNGQPIGQYGLIKISTSSYIQILGVITKFRNIYRTLFK
jgi:hypothetical protein